jgi:hypothetical protein
MPAHSASADARERADVAGIHVFPTQASQLVQAIAGFDGGDATESFDSIDPSSDPSQQPWLTTSQQA